MKNMINANISFIIFYEYFIHNFLKDLNDSDKIQYFMFQYKLERYLTFTDILLELNFLQILADMRIMEKFQMRELKTLENVLKIYTNE